MSSPDPQVIARALRSVGRTFYGGCLENRGAAPMGKGHNNDGNPFDISTACYLKPIFDEYDKAIRNRTKLKLVIKAGVKTMKSFALEIMAADHVCNRNGDAAIFFGSGDVADTVSTTRIVDDFRGFKRFQRKLESISNLTGEARHKITNGAIKFPDKTFFLLPANLNTLQQKNLGFVGLQDAFTTGKTGMIGEMLARTTQYQDRIVVLESQGGEEGFDFDRQYEDTDERELHVNCPLCGMANIWNWKGWHRERQDDFVPVPPKNIPSLDHAAWIEHHRTILLSPEYRHCGFKRGDNAKFDDGEYNEQAILKDTHYQCYFCGGAWHDDGQFGATRIALDESSHYVAARSNALLGNIGFNIPQWVNRRLPWGEMMLGYLTGLKTNKRLGNDEEIKIWWQKVAARTWQSGLTSGFSAPLPANIFDTETPLPGELCRISTLDIQLELTNAWIQVWAVGEGSKIRLLHREHLESPIGMTADERRDHVKNLARAIWKFYKVQPQNVQIDLGHIPDKIFEWAAEDCVRGVRVKGSDGRITMRDVFYGLVRGDDKPFYIHKISGKGGERSQQACFSVPFYKPVVVTVAGRRETLSVPYRLMSNPQTQRMAQRFIEKDDAPEMEIPQFVKYEGRTISILADTSLQGFWAQMNSEVPDTSKKNLGKGMWCQVHQRPNHDRDNFRQLLKRLSERGYLSFASKGEEASKV